MNAGGDFSMICDALREKREEEKLPRERYLRCGWSYGGHSTRDLDLSCLFASAAALPEAVPPVPSFGLLQIETRMYIYVRRPCAMR